MATSEPLPFEDLSADWQRMNRQLAPGSICAPTWVKLRSRNGEEQLAWGFEKAKGSDPVDFDQQSWRYVRAKRDLLQRFLKLADAPSQDIEQFAERFGVLGICEEHGLPVCHQEGCLPLGFSRDCHEPVRSWREYAARMQAIYEIARELRAGRLGEDSDWWLLHPQFEKNRPFETIWVDETRRNWRASKRRKQLDLARFYLREEMDTLLKLGDVGLRLEWQRAAHSKGIPQPAQWVVRMRYGHWLNLFGALVLQLLLEVCDSGDEVYICSSCGKSYARVGRRPNASQKNYCPSCQSDKEPQREADRSRRQRMREAWLLHNQGVALQQIADRLNTKPDHVARWIKRRVERKDL